MRNVFLGDLHIHTVLSPCGDWDMDAINIVKKAIEIGLDIIAVTDHNSVRNSPAVIKAAGDSLFVLPGMELQTKEDIHIVCLFPSVDMAFSFEEYVWDNMPYKRNMPDFFGEQVVIDEHNNVVECLERMLLLGTNFRADDIIDIVFNRFGGIAILSHIDRPRYSYTSVLGFVPEGLSCALEVSCCCSIEDLKGFIRYYSSYSVITSSDAHYLSDIKIECSTLFYIDKLCFDSLKEAIYNKGCIPYKLKNS